MRITVVASAVVASAVVAAVAALLSGCSPHPGAQGDCTVRVLYSGAVYRPVVVQSLPRPGRSLGSAVFGDCDGEPLRTPEKGTLFAFPGVDIGRAVLVHSGRHRTVYVNTAIKARNWPALVKTAYRAPVCEHPVRFTARMEIFAGVDADVPDEKELDIPVPYTATFTATRGKGLDLDTWSRVELDARISSNTDPVPSPRFLKQALAVKNPRHVVVTATCRGTKFDVTDIKFAQ